MATRARLMVDRMVSENIQRTPHGHMSENYLSECYVLLLLDVRVVYQWDSAQVLTDPSQEVTAAMVRGSRSESI